MKNKLYLTGFLLGVVVLAGALTKYRSIQLLNSAVDSTVIGATTPSTGNFTNLTVNGFIVPLAPIYNNGGTRLDISPGYHLSTGSCNSGGGGTCAVVFSGAAAFSNAAYQCQATKIGPSSGIAFYTINGSNSVQLSAGGNQIITVICYGI